jgi:hypothetical protein
MSWYFCLWADENLRQQLSSVLFGCQWFSPSMTNLYISLGYFTKIIKKVAAI